MHIVSRRPSDRRAARMAPLSVLPVFFRLQGRRAVVAGGSDAVAWKAELLIAAGAIVHLYAPTETLGEAFARLLAGEGSGDRIIHRDRNWGVDSFAGAALAVAGAETDAQAFRAAAQTAGVPVNVIDQPALCDFQFGSIVNRSPVVVGVSTDGAAPILAQAIRRRIETLLPQSLSAWAALAHKMRAALNERLQPGMARRAFWEGFAERAFGPAPTKEDETALMGQSERFAAVKARRMGQVTLVGAGPGDAELLTLKAVRALQSADVILFDDLISDEVLELARREAKRILVGKRGGRPSCRQDDINELMVKLAKAGKRVVRLKSGDPLIFGRAGEEIARLEAEGVPVDIVPGITSAFAMAAALGVSLTHRDYAKSVRFVTGHSRKGGLPEDLDWNAVADRSTTTIFYMGGRTAGPIADRLMARGLAATTPVAVASAVSRPGQRIWICTLETLSSTMEAVAEADPVIIGVGAAFGSGGKDTADANGFLLGSALKTALLS
ncbi:Uroporphyrinogen-III C-methyltransferase / Precorrin-2 dehydrogenase / Sirohydrochlorin ferrochelatase [Methylocella tundrae]|uniref:Uroporphyrinogen-III C-methyltransferase / Precorrin-2 dehydrogenase / Sirohydrochlorin ferrochelatase n=1 Tax=Methylocella tundrae TaxID=227605 RepID=A0A8B6M8S7_METTU|nr:Uroporphyrinogen-III C-methyltransferase / Precorrin-2 dehydrogenase / Sirohydrochlorin ferrochelatase [Methylocella tundrae]